MKAKIEPSCGIIEIKAGVMDTADRIRELEKRVKALESKKPSRPRPEWSKRGRR